MLKQADGPVDGYVTVEIRAGIEPGVTIARYTHPGIETGHVVEGGFRPRNRRNRRAHREARRRLPGPRRDASQRQKRPGKTVAVAIYVVEKGKPLASPA